MSVADVLAGRARAHIACMRALYFLRGLPSDSVDLIFTSPPYEDCRLYGELGFRLKGQAWVDWIMELWPECQRVCKGLVAFVVEGKTTNYRWSATPALLMADLHRAGFKLRNPSDFIRVGIPGSGGPDWFRNDKEFIVCTTRGKLPWSDNTVCGHPPLWAPGGAMSHRLKDGQRVNQWGQGVGGGNQRRQNGERQKSGRPSHERLRIKGGSPKDSVRDRDKWGGTGNRTGMQGRKPNGEHKRRVTRGKKDGDTQNTDSYNPPVLANPGNVQMATYTADQVAAILEQYERGDWSRHIVGGGVMGHPSATENEAPFPLTLPERYIRSCCPPDGIVCDPFLGSGTTGHAAILWRRRFIGCDLRAGQVEIARNRLSGITPMLLDVPGVK